MGKAKNKIVVSGLIELIKNADLSPDEEKALFKAVEIVKNQAE